jgi:hypothetical protein
MPMTRTTQNALTARLNPSVNATGDLITNDRVQNGKPQEVKDEAAASQCDLNAIGGHTKPLQFGRRICCLGDGPARAYGRASIFGLAPLAALSIQVVFPRPSQRQRTGNQDQAGTEGKTVHGRRCSTVKSIMLAAGALSC